VLPQVETFAISNLNNALNYYQDLKDKDQDLQANLVKK